MLGSKSVWISGGEMAGTVMTARVRTTTETLKAYLATVERMEQIVTAPEKPKAEKVAPAPKKQQL